jgi:hypothetical protein
MAPATLTSAALIALAAVWALTGFSTPSISDQLSAAEREGSSDGRRVVLLKTADLHGSGIRSHVLLFLDKPGTRTPRSDDLRIYDEHGNKLVLAFRFQPTGPRAVFQYRAATVVDFDGADAIVGGYGYAGDAREAIVPFAVDWDNGAERYRLISLDMGAPTLPAASRIFAETQYRRVYDQQTTFTDPPDHLMLTGHRVQDFTVTPTPHRLVAGWFLIPWLGTHEAKFELHTSIFDSSTGAPHLTPCKLTGLTRPLVVHMGQERAPMNVFEEAYTAASTGNYCAPSASG